MIAVNEETRAPDTARRPEPLSMDERQKILQDLESLQLAENLSNSQVARLLDCSPATWSLIKKGRYSGNVDRFLHRGAAVLKARSERRDLPTGGFVETSIGLGILRISKLAADLGDMALVITPSGCGKTAALREFARRRGDQAVYVQAGECARTKLALLRTLARELGADLAASASIERAYQAVRAKLAAAFSCGIGAAKIIIIDEAQTLEGSALNLLRNLHDDPECQAVVILADTWRIQAEFARLGVIAGGYEQLTSRFGAVYSLSSNARTDPISLADVRLLAQATVEGMGSDVRLGEEPLKVLAQLAQERGKLRNVVKRLRAVYTIAEHAGRRAAFTVREIEQAAQVLGSQSRLAQAAPAWARAKEDQPAAAAAENPAA